MNSLLSQFSVRIKLFAGFGIVLGLMIVMSLVAFGQMRYIHHQVEEVVDGSVGPLIQAQALQASNKDMGIAVRDIVSLESVSSQKQAIKVLKEVQKRFVETLAESQKSAAGRGEELALLDKADSQYKAIVPMIDDVLGKVDESDFDGAKVFVFTKLRPKQMELAETIQEFLQLQVGKARQASDASRNAFTGASSTLVIFVAIALAVGSGLALVVTGGIVGPLERAARFAATVAKGDFSQRVQGVGKDEVSLLLVALNDMSESLGVTIHQIREEANRTANYAQQLANDARSASDRSQEQVGQVMSITSAMEEMSVSIREVSGNAEGVHQAAELARSLSVKGCDRMTQNLSEVQLIVRQVEESGSIIAELSQAITQISTITGTIKDIADQTNLLALNAAIEAARAGESGRGFAVVADEVRKLAERTGHSTAEIAATLSTIETKAAETVSSMAHVKETVESGARDSASVDATLRQIVEAAARVSTLVGDIAAATQEQTRTTEATARSVEAISDVSEETSRTIQHVGATATEMNQVSQELLQLVGKFRINA